MKRVNVVGMRGLLGELYSRGIDTLGAKLAKLGGVDYITVEDYTSWRPIRDRILKWKDPTILYGHSFGSNAATVIAESLYGKVNIPLIFSIDPSQYWSWSLFRFGPADIGPNVAKTISYYQKVDLVGRQKLSGVNVQNVAVEGTSHIQIDDLSLVHDAAIDAVKRVIG